MRYAIDECEKRFAEKSALKYSPYETQNAGNCRSEKRFDR